MEVVENQELGSVETATVASNPVTQNGSHDEVITEREQSDDNQQRKDEIERLFDLNLVRDQFVTKFKSLVEQNEFTSLQTTPLWMLSEILVPINRRGNNMATEKWTGGGALRTRYSDPINYPDLFTDDEKTIPEFEGRSSDIDSSHISMPFTFYSDMEVKVGLHLYTMFAYNQHGQHSAPLVVFPRSDDSLETNLDGKPITKAFCMETSNNGDLDHIDKFINWLSLFGMQIESNARPTIILISSLMFLKLSKLITNREQYKSLADALSERNFYLIVYPVESKLDDPNSLVYEQFCHDWKESLRQTTLLKNPNDELSFIQTYFGALAMSMIEHKDLTRKTFNQLIERFGLNLELMPEASETTATATNGEENGTGNIDEEAGGEDGAVATGSNPTKLSEMSEQEIDDYVEWIESMSKIGCLSIKHVFLRDLFLKTQKQNQSSGKELLANEKSWLWMINKNKAKFKNKNSIVSLNETEYFLKWSDQEFWRKQYIKYARTQLHLRNSNHLWTFEIIQFPYAIKDGMLRMPESDYSQRPKQLKPRVSVLFAYNVTGDYIAPFFIFPSNFTNDDETTPNEKIECLVSPNGHVTSRIFEHWLYSHFMPYVSSNCPDDGNNKILLVMCGKLPLLDKQLYKRVQTENTNVDAKFKLNFFMLPNENLQPFNLLFKEKERKRQVDLFTESWRKVTKQLQLGSQFKCHSRIKFKDIFTEAFQNCIEEIGLHTSQSNNLDELNDSFVKYFGKRMSDTFHACKLWPLTE